MSMLQRGLRWLGVFALPMLVLSAVPAFADNPPPQDPTLTVGGGTGPYVASVEAWEECLAVIESIYPDITYVDATALALEWFNLLPPEEYSPPSSEPPPANDPPPEDPPVVEDPPAEDPGSPLRPATPEEWAAASDFIREYFFPDIDDETLAQIILEWFLLLPPE